MYRVRNVFGGHWYWLSNFCTSEERAWEAAYKSLLHKRLVLPLIVRPSHPHES